MYGWIEHCASPQTASTEQITNDHLLSAPIITVSVPVKAIHRLKVKRPRLHQTAFFQLPAEEGWADHRKDTEKPQTHPTLTSYRNARDRTKKMAPTPMRVSSGPKDRGCVCVRPAAPAFSATIGLREFSVL